MYFLYLPSDVRYEMTRPVIIQAGGQCEAANMFDQHFGFYPGMQTSSYDNLEEMVDAHNLHKAVILEKVDTIGFEYGTDSDEFGFLFV